MMSRRTIAIAAACIIVADYYVNTFRKKKRRSKWVKNWIANRYRFGHMALVTELRSNEPQDFKNYLRMADSEFDHLMGLLRPYLTKKDTVMRQSIPAEERLMATLRFLATGNSYEDLKFSTAIAAQTLGYIIPETCRIIYNVLKNDYMKVPRTKKKWKDIANGFKNRWNMPNCGGCIDGKHIRIKAPHKSGATYYNYKNFYSVVLMAVVNSKYEFVYVDVGKQGRLSDGGVIQTTSFYQKLSNNTLGLPECTENEEGLNFVFIADEAFALHKNMLKPYPQRDLTYEKRIYNYRVSRARNVVENAFGLLASVFRILHTAINLPPEKVTYIVLAICTLHNFLRQNSRGYINSTTLDTEDDNTHDLIAGSWRNDMINVNEALVPLQLNTGKNALSDAKINREQYLNYFNGKGKVPWQDDMIRKGRA